MFSKALFFGLIAMVVVAVVNTFIPLIQSGRFLWREPLKRSLLTGVGIAAALYIAMKAFEIISRARGPASSGNRSSGTGSFDYTNEKITPDEIEEEPEEGPEMAAKAVSPDEETPVSPEEKKQEKSSPETTEKKEDSLDTEEASEIADLISETIDEE